MSATHVLTDIQTRIITLFWHKFHAKVVLTDILAAIHSDTQRVRELGIGTETCGAELTSLAAAQPNLERVNCEVGRGSIDTVALLGGFLKWGIPKIVGL